MSNLLLKNYVRLLIETEDPQARVPNQLLNPKTLAKKRKEKSNNRKKKKQKEQDVNEFSGVGAIAGYTAPLGASSDDMGAEHGKKKEPGWSLP